MADMNLRAAANAASIPSPSSTWLGPWTDVQRMQWQTLLEWQNSMIAFQKDLWDQWACRYGGGVPIDG